MRRVLKTLKDTENEVEARVFHKNLKIFKDPDFSENQVLDTVFHALSIGHKIRAVRNL